MKILIINSGSSSIKYRLFHMRDEAVLATGLLEKIGEQDSRLLHKGAAELEETRCIATHREGLSRIVRVLNDSGALGCETELLAVGHRVVHGGEAFREATLIDESAIGKIRELIALAPLHNPANLLGIEVCRQLWPSVPQVAVFDTAFHQSLPPHAFHYAVPADFYRHYRVRRYGFHGTSHHFVAKQAAIHLEQPLETLRLITLHLGNGASATAIRAGKSIDTSMGMTPLAGLMMGTRSGDIDAGVLPYLAATSGQSLETLDALLNRESGLKGVCGENDMRKVQRKAEAGDQRAQLAIEMYCYRIKHYIGAYFAVLGRVDALVFTGGVGENDASIRKLSCAGLDTFGIRIDDEKNASNAKKSREIQAANAPVKLLVIPSDEELEIARQTAALIAPDVLPHGLADT